MRILSLAAGLAFWASGGLSAPPASAPADLVVVEPPDSGGVLTNPDMGWVFHHYDNAVWNYGSKLGDRYVCDDFPGVSVVYLRLAWSYLEPREGHFNWSYVDKIAQRYIQAGKRVAFRFTCSETPIRYATPEWVRQAGAKGHDWRPRVGVVKDGPLWAPDFDDPIFLAKLDAFLAAAAKRYDGDPNVAFIDIGSFGLWGEGHTGFSRLHYEPEVVIRHIDLHLKHFRRTLLVAQDDWPGRSCLPALRRAGAEIDMPVRIVLGPEHRGKSFDVTVGLWRPRNLEDPHGRSLPRRGGSDRRVRLGRLTMNGDGRLSFETVQAEAEKADGLYDVRVSGPVRIEGRRCFILLRWSVAKPLPADSEPFCHLDGLGHMQGTVITQEYPAQDYARAKGLSIRDDSILVQPPPRAYFNWWMARNIWPRVPIVLESEHYGGSRDRKCWGDGSWYLQAVEDYHASYASIHWWPAEFLAENRDLVRRISLRMGYRLRPIQASWPAQARRGQTIELVSRWQNVGVAPCYGGGQPCWTLKAADGAVAGVFVDERLDVRDLAVGSPAQAASCLLVRGSTVRAIIDDSVKPGAYDVFLSVGSPQGTPRYELPLADGDGHKRYKVGKFQIK